MDILSKPLVFTHLYYLSFIVALIPRALAGHNSSTAIILMSYNLRQQAILGDCTLLGRTFVFISIHLPHFSLPVLRKIVTSKWVGLLPDAAMIVFLIYHLPILSFLPCFMILTITGIKCWKASSSSSNKHTHQYWWTHCYQTAFYHDIVLQFLTGGRLGISVASWLVGPLLKK